MLISYQISVPSRAVCSEIGPVIWKIGSIDFVKMCQKDSFLLDCASFLALKLSFWHKNSPKFLKFCRIGPSSKTLEEILYQIFLYILFLHLKLRVCMQ